MEVTRKYRVSFVKDTNKHAVCGSCYARQGTAQIYAVLVGNTNYQPLCMECALVLSGQIATMKQEEES